MKEAFPLAFDAPMMAIAYVMLFHRGNVPSTRLPPSFCIAGSKLRHWPPGTNNEPFVPSFFACDISLLLHTIIP